MSRRPDTGVLRFLAAAGIWRGAAETFALSIVLTLYLGWLERYFPDAVRSSGVILISFAGALLFSLRLRVKRGQRTGRFLDEVLLAGVLLLVQFVGVLALAYLFGIMGMGWSLWLTDSGLPAFFLAGLVAFCIFRAGLRAALKWEEARRRSLVWSLTGLHVAFFVGLVWLGVGAWLIWSMATGRSPLFFGSLAYLGTDTLLAMLPLTIITWAVASITLAMVFFPMSAGLSYLLIRPVVRRITRLADATRSFRSGNRNAAVTVEGQDEIAQLTMDFNAMAESLSASLSQLEGERDRAAKLLESRRILFAQVSHELRTPIAILRGYLDSIEAHWDELPPQTLKNDLAVIQRETVRLQSLVDDLFAIARSEADGLSLAPQPVPPHQVVRSVVDSLAPLAWERERVQVTSDVAEAAPLVAADPRRLEQILYNLVRNGIRHTPPGGLVSLSAAAEEGVVRFEVRNTGEAIPPEEAGRVWERFYQAGNRGRPSDGAGLGLFIVKEFTEAMGGSVELISTPDTGSCFTVRLPRA